MLTLQQIYRRTPKQRINAAKYVKMVRTRKGYNDDGTAFIAAQTYSTHEWDAALHQWITSKNRPKYISVIVFLDKKLHCKVSCSCPDFTFGGWEYSLNQRDAADIEYSNGQPPTVRNPGQTPGMCKHLVRLYLSIKDIIR